MKRQWFVYIKVPVSIGCYTSKSDNLWSTSLVFIILQISLGKPWTAHVQFMVYQVRFVGWWKLRMYFINYHFWKYNIQLKQVPLCIQIIVFSHCVCIPLLFSDSVKYSHLYLEYSGQLRCHMVQTISVGTHSTTEYKIGLQIFTRHTQVPLTTYIIVYELKCVAVHM